ncbi:MAG: Holliday junction resolvase RuvX [Bacteroidota bacterium]
MGRIIAIDFGRKRVGLAVTDPLKIIASSLETISPKELLPYLTNYFVKEKVDTIVLGMPTKLDGSDTNITSAVKGLTGVLKKTFPEIEIVNHDERFTSGIALRSMIASGTSKKERRTKGNIDKVSATIILQSYMESLDLQKKW